MVNNYLASGVPVWRFLADQLLLPLAAGAGGNYLTGPLSLHTRTNIEVIGMFLDVGIELENKQNGQYIIKVKK